MVRRSTFSATSWSQAPESSRMKFLLVLSIWPATRPTAKKLSKARANRRGFRPADGEGRVQEFSYALRLTPPGRGTTVAPSHSGRHSDRSCDWPAADRALVRLPAQCAGPARDRPAGRLSDCLFGLAQPPSLQSEAPAPLPLRRTRELCRDPPLGGILDRAPGDAALHRSGRRHRRRPRHADRPPAQRIVPGARPRQDARADTVGHHLGVVNGLMWQWIYDAKVGALNGLLVSLGLLAGYRGWLSDPTSALLALVTAHVWNALPLAVILLLAALQSIPAELYDAGHVDGSAGWRLFRHVTLPWLAQPLLVVLILQTMLAVRVFDLIYVLTAGGPGTATTTLVWQTYLTPFDSLDFGLGNAYAYPVSLITLGLALLYFHLLYGRGEFEA